MGRFKRLQDVPSQYRREGETVLIELRLSQVGQLFNMLDPAPFHERDLDDDADAYLVGCAREIPARYPVKIVLHLPAAAAGAETAHTLQQAIRHYFVYRSHSQQRELRRLFGEARRGMLVGLGCLIVCLGLKTLVEYLDRAHALLITGWIGESLLIIGWVAMWRPVEMALFDWHPARQTLAVYRRLARVVVELRLRANGGAARPA